MKNKILLATISIAAAFSSAGVIAGGSPAGITNAYVTTEQGKIVTDLKGDCIRTIDWKPELALPQCEGVKKVVIKQPVIKKPQAEFVTVSLSAGALFDTAKYSLKPRGQEKLNVLATRLRQTIKTDLIRVEGHTDSSGSDAYNQRLSERRAAAVKTYLLGRGVSHAKIETIGYGESRPIANNTTPAGRTKNRRVVVKIRATKQVQ